MVQLILIALAGLAAQLVDGGLGMGFGATSTTMLILFAGLGPAQASAVVHAAELGTTLVSGVSHWKFGNVDWSVVAKLAVPGALGSFIGAVVLSGLSTAAATPITATILVAIGVHLVWRFSRGRVRRRRGAGPHSTGFLGGLGLFGGFIDATGGGGWGPVTTSTLLTAGRAEPRRIIGTVDTAEFIVTLAAVLGFVTGLWDDLVANAAAMLALLIGGSIAAPIAAWAVTRLNPVALGGAVGTLLVVLNLPKMLHYLGIDGAAASVACVLVAAIGLALSARGYLRWRADQARRARDSRAARTVPPATGEKPQASIEGSPMRSTQPEGAAAPE